MTAFHFLYRKAIYGLLLFVGLFFFNIAARAQAKADTSHMVTINILNTERSPHVKTDSGDITKLIGNVRLEHAGTLMNCDSAYINQSNNLEAFGNVKIVQPDGTQGQSDYLRYISGKKLAYMKGNVSLTDGKNNLWSEDLTYDLGTKIGVYEQGGTLQSESTTLSSNAGTYNLKSKDARFVGDVFVTDPDYNATSEDLGYNTETKIVQFYAPSVVTNSTSVLHTKSGTYDSKNEVAHMIARASMWHEDQYIEADTIDYSKVTGYGKAKGRVVAIDTAHHSTLYCGYAVYNEKSRKMKAMIKPVLKQINDNDSLFIRADTFYTAPIPKPEDTMRLKQVKEIVKTKEKKEKQQQIKQDTIAISTADSIAGADSTRQRYFIGYHHVKIYSDSLQGLCDSISYTDIDSVMRMMRDPIAWSRSSQITGDTILLYLDSSKLKKLYVPNNALVVSQSGPTKAQMYDQVQGKTLTGYFVDNTIKDMLVWPNAESIYYAKDDSGAYLGINQAQSERMKVFFEDQKIKRIIFEQQVKQTMTPLDKADIPATRLSRFKWLMDKRPKNREELFQ